jgi:hypothetical protein
MSSHEGSVKFTSAFFRLIPMDPNLRASAFVLPACARLADEASCRAADAGQSLSLFPAQGIRR